MLVELVAAHELIFMIEFDDSQGRWGVGRTKCLRCAARDAMRAVVRRVLGGSRDPTTGNFRIGVRCPLAHPVLARRVVKSLQESRLVA